MPMLCSDHAILLKATAQHVRRETACGLPARVRLLPATTRSSVKVVIRRIPISDAGGQCEAKQCLSWRRKRVVAAHYKKDYLLNCWTSSSDTSGCHADFHEGHGSIGACQGCGMAWRGHGMLCVNQPLCYFVWVVLCVISVRILYVVHPSLAPLWMWPVLQILSVRWKFVIWNQWQCDFKCTDHALARVKSQTVCPQSKRVVLKVKNRYKLLCVTLKIYKVKVKWLTSLL